jgi:hypothetical protein
MEDETDMGAKVAKSPEILNTKDTKYTKGKAML